MPMPHLQILFKNDKGEIQDFLKTLILVFHSATLTPIRDRNEFRFAEAGAFVMKLGIILYSLENKKTNNTRKYGCEKHFIV
jgi:hypothetical protein